MKRIERFGSTERKTQQQVEPEEKQSKQKWITSVLKAVIISSVVFGITYFCVVSFLDVGIFLRSIITLILSVLALISVEVVDVAHLKRPVVCYITILFICSLLSDYKEINREAEKSLVADETWLLEKVFRCDDEVFIVTDGPVLINGKNFDEGNYLVPIKKSGKLMFENVSDTTIKISVTKKK